MKEGNMRKDVGTIIGLLLFMSVNLNGCAMVGVMIGGIGNEYIEKTTFKAKKQSKDIIDDITEVGTEMGYQVTGLDRDKKSVTVGKPINYATMVLIGKYSMIRINVEAKQNNNFDITCLIYGNFDAATHAEANKILKEFKDRLNQKIS